MTNWNKWERERGEGTCRRRRRTGLFSIRPLREDNTCHFLILLCFLSCGKSFSIYISGCYQLSFYWNSDTFHKIGDDNWEEKKLNLCARDPLKIFNIWPFSASHMEPVYQGYLPPYTVSIIHFCDGWFYLFSCSTCDASVLGNWKMAAVKSQTNISFPYLL